MIEQELNASIIMDEIEPLVKKGVPYMDALLLYAKNHNIEIEVVGEIVRRSQNLKQLVREEAEDMNLVEKISRLPI